MHTNLPLSFSVSGRQRVSKRDAQFTNEIDRDVELNVYQCFYENCGTPIDENTIPPPENRPDDAVYWSDPTAWDGTEAGWGGNNGDGTFGPPADNTDVKIPTGR